eukprot:gene16279-19320_t
MAAAVCQFACQLLVENCKPKYVVVKFQDGFVEAFNIQKRTPEFRFILAEVILDKEMGPRPGTSGLRIQHPLTGATFSLVAPTVTITDGAAPGAKGEEVDQVMQQVQLLLIDKSKASADKMQMERHIADLEERLEYLEETHDSLLEHFNEEMANLEREIEGKNRELTDLEDELSKRQDTIDEMTSQEALRLN